MQLSIAHKPVILLTLFSLLASVLSAPIAKAQDTPPATPPVLQVSTAAEGAVIRYDAAQGSLSAADAAQQLPSQRYNGYQLPIQFFTLQVAAGSEPRIDLQGVAASPLAEPLQPATPETPPALGWEPDPGYTPPAPVLPTEPVFIARQGLIRGQRIVVVGVSPIFAAGGAPQLASSFQAFVSGTAPVAESPLQTTQAQSAVVQSPGSTEVFTDVQVNAAALVDSFKLVVSEPGMQEVFYSELGLTSEPAELRLRVNNLDVAAERAGDRLRFYVPEVGDRWNRTTTYWVTLEVGRRMAQRADVPAGPEIVAYEEGKWIDNRLYEPAYAGADGDHWFHADLKLPMGIDFMQYTPITVPVTTVLPLRAGASVFQMISTPTVKPPSERYCNTPYQMHVQGLINGNLAETQVVNWQPVINCKLSPTSTAVFSSTAPITSMLLRLHPNGFYSSGIKFEAVKWRRPVDLDFSGITGSVEFVTDMGDGSVLLRNLPSSWRLYDVSVINEVKIVASGSGGSYMLNQVYDVASRRYVLADLAASHKPVVQRFVANGLGGVKAADAMYIGPAAFADELAPLLALRKQQGFDARFVDVQYIYDVFGFGQISAVAIRNFLRLESDWQNPNRIVTVVLVGDATVDPFAYNGIANNTTVAAWIDEVDPYQGALGKPGEAACDACIAQLNGPDPLTGDSLTGGRDWFAADVWIGRLPARNEQELADMVSKLVAYDNDADNNAPWRMRKVFLADNYIKTLDAQMNAKPDDAGDFAILSDNIVNMLPNPARVRRIYYDPAPDRQVTSTAVAGGYYQTVPRTLPENWRISNGSSVNNAVITRLNMGAGLVAYNGHSNHFYYGRIEDLEGDDKKDKWLLNAPEVSLLSNTGKEFVMLSMTCYTSQFVMPTANGTIDEWLIRHKDGGAIAVWGPTGLSVVSGHDLLQKGFVQQLLNTSSEQRLGNLVEAGYTNLLTQNGPLDPLMTFVLLGDPLTRARIPQVSLDDTLYLPWASWQTGAD